MPRRATPVTPTDVTRYLKGVFAAGVPVDRFAGLKMTKDGVFALFGEMTAAQTEAPNEWDEVLK